LQVNDDEAERRKSRRFDMSMSELESGTNINEVADSLTSCLKMYAENVSLLLLLLDYFPCST